MSELFSRLLLHVFRPPVFTRLSRSALNSRLSPDYTFLHGPMLVGTPRAKLTYGHGWRIPTVHGGRDGFWFIQQMIDD